MTAKKSAQKTRKFPPDRFVKSMVYETRNFSFFVLAMSNSYVEFRLRNLMKNAGR